MIPRYDEGELLIVRSRFADVLQNALGAIAAGDFVPLRPRAQKPTANMTLYVEGAFLEGYIAPVLFGSEISAFTGGSTGTFTAPTIYSRIDIVSLDSTGNLNISTGVESLSPSAPSVPSTDVGICQVFLPVGCTKIVNKEDLPYNEGQAYIYRDITPKISMPPLTSSVLSSLYVGLTNTFGGTGVDGNVVISSNTTIAPNVVKNYNNLLVEAGKTLSLSSAGNMYLCVKGSLTVNGTISVVGMGATGGGAGATGTEGFFPGGNGTSTGNDFSYGPYALLTGIALMGSVLYPKVATFLSQMIGGGGGGGSGGGGNGGGVIIIEVLGDVTVNVGGIITASGAAGTGTGGGGGGGCAVVVYHGDYVNNGSVIANGGGTGALAGLALHFFT